MRVSIYQPQYFPRLHYYNRILHADAFVILDSAQYTKSLVHSTPQGKERNPTYQSTTPLKTESKDNLLSVAVRHNGYHPIHETILDYSQKWPLQHAAVIKNNYKKAKMFETIYPEIKELISYE